MEGAASRRGVQRVQSSALRCTEYESRKLQLRRGDSCSVESVPNTTARAEAFILIKLSVRSQTHHPCPALHKKSIETECVSDPCRFAAVPLRKGDNKAIGINTAILPLANGSVAGGGEGGRSQYQAAVFVQSPQAQID